MVYELSEYGLRSWLRRVEGVIDRDDTLRVEEFMFDFLYGDGVCVVTRGIGEFLVTFLFEYGDRDFIIGVADDGLGDAIEEFLAEFLYGDGLGAVTGTGNGFGDNIEGIEEFLVDFLYGERMGDLTLPGDAILGITDRRL